MKSVIKIIFIGLIICFVLFLTFIGINKYKAYKEEQKIKNAIIKVELIDDLNIPFNSQVKVSDFIKSINGTIIDDNKIDTSIVGKKEVSFNYINEEDIKLPYKFSINVIDDVPPMVVVSNPYTVTVGYKKNLLDVLFCADNYDDNPSCVIKGEYDVNKVGSYHLSYEAIDFSNNKTVKEFTLRVIEPSSSKKTSSKVTTIPFNELYQEYKTDHTTIGIDVSKWQGKIDYQKVKDAGVEFVFIKLGGQSGIGKEYYLDPKFKDNFEGFKKVGIPVGLYFYSYANSVEGAQKDALWVREQIKDYKIDLPIAFDWENWSSFNKFNVSFNTLTNSFKQFKRVLNFYGYNVMLYSSKNYLEKIWLDKSFPVWLAHYTKATDYKGEYNCWQRTSSAKIPGITENTVDFDICYQK